jgi:hypothetical protein
MECFPPGNATCTLGIVGELVFGWRKRGTAGYLVKWRRKQKYQHMKVSVSCHY